MGRQTDVQIDRQIELSFNLNKTKYIIFRYRKNLNQTQIMIDNIEIQRVNTFLGVIIDHKLSWK